MDSILSIEDLKSMNELELVSVLGSVFYNSNERYNGSVKNIAEQAQQDMAKLFPIEIKNRMCKYISSYVSDICQIQDKGDVTIVKGTYITSGGIPWDHHWNYDHESGLFIDAMANRLFLSTGEDEFFRQRYEFDKYNMNHTSREIFDGEGELMLELVEPFVTGASEVPYPEILKRLAS